MAQLIINQEATLRNYLEAFGPKFNAPQWKYFVTVLMGLLHCEGSKTLSGLLRQVAVVVTDTFGRPWRTGLTGRIPMFLSRW